MLCHQSGQQHPQNGLCGCLSPESVELNQDKTQTKRVCPADRYKVMFALATAPCVKSLLPGESAAAHACLYGSAQVPGSPSEGSCPQLHTLSNILPLCTY